MKIDTIWVVTRPSPVSEMVDLLFEADPGRLELQFRGGLKGKDVIGMFTTFPEARAAAIEAIRQRDEGVPA